MVTIILTFAAITGFHAWRWLGDRGTREHIAWLISLEEYNEYVCKLDRSGAIIRECGSLLLHIGARKMVLRQIALQFAFILAIVLVAHMLDVSGSIIAIPIALYLATSAILSAWGTRTVQRIDQFNFGRRYWVLIGLSTVAAVLLAWVGLTAYFGMAFDGSFSTARYFAQGAIALAALALSVLVVEMSFRVGERRSPSTTFARQAGQDAALFLRSFSDDALKVYAPFSNHRVNQLCGSRQTFERLIAMCLVKNAKLIAIGRPGERLPALGAARTYWPDDQWQEAVKTTAARAKAIILVAGSSQGLSWEVNQLRAWGLLSKAIFLLPPLPEEGTNRRINRLLEDLNMPGSVYDQVGELSTTTLTALRVSADGTPIFHIAAGRDWANYFGTIMYFFNEVDGKTVPPAPGELAKLNEDE